MKDIKAYNEVVRKMRFFFQEVKGFIEVPAQSRQSILAACEDPATISQYIFSGTNWPLPQTGQMWLEEELLKNPDIPGVFCITTSYRNEPNPIEGRHDKIFPMFEFESHGTIEDMVKLEEELLISLGFNDEPVHTTYEEMSEKYDTDILEAEHEERMWDEEGNIVFLKDFPERTHPFWNMKHSGSGVYNKVDVIMHGMETIGSAERSCDIDEMWDNFHTISDGEYANLLFNHFGKKRVEDELDAFLKHEMFPRFGAGIGVTRMARAFKQSNLIKGLTSGL